jgi:Arc/MetJ family transcription regulator
VLLFLSEAIKCYYNTSFWVKITTLPVALAFTFAVRERFARGALYTSAYSQWVGSADLLLWFIVAAGGRWIGFS